VKRSEIVIVSEQEAFINDVLYCFQTSGLEVTHIPIKTWHELTCAGEQALLNIVIIDSNSQEFPTQDVFAFSKNSNPDCLLYVVFEELEEELISNFIRMGATSFALKTNLFSLPASIQKVLTGTHYEVIIPVAIKREYFLASFFEQATEALWIKDKEGKYLLINPTGARFVSRPIEDIIGKSDYDIFPADTAAKICKSDKSVLERGATQVIEDTITNRENVKRIFQAVKTVLRDQKGEVQGLIGTIRDITERKQAEESAKEAERRFNMLIQHVKDAAVYMLDPTSNS
jgi:PAS domain S-box-containing protein